MNITESRDEAFEAIAEMLRSNVKKTKIASKLSADYCVSDKTVYKWINKVEEMYDIEPIESILLQHKSELKSEIYQDLIRDYHKAKDENDLINQIEDFIGHPIETMTYKTNNVSVSYPRYEEVSNV